MASDMVWGGGGENTEKVSRRLRYRRRRGGGGFRYIHVPVAGSPIMRCMRSGGSGGVGDSYSHWSYPNIGISNSNEVLLFATKIIVCIRMK